VTSIALFASFARTRISAPYFFLWRPSLPDPKDDFILELAVESRADFLLTFNSKDFAGADSFGVRVISPREFLAIIRRGAMTINVTVPDGVYRQIAELAARQQVSVERIVSAALTEQLSGWARVEQMAERASREHFLAALDKVPPAEPAPEDRI
jgi:hypothetical protein